MLRTNGLLLFFICMKAPSDRFENSCVMFDLRRHFTRALLNPGTLTVLVLALSSALAHAWLRPPLAPHEPLDWIWTSFLSAMLWLFFTSIRDGWFTSSRARRVATFVSAPLLATGLTASLMIHERLGEYLGWGMIRYAFESGGGSARGFVTTYTSWWHALTVLILTLIVGAIWLEGSPTGLSRGGARRATVGLGILLCASLAITPWLAPRFRATTPDIALITATIHAITEPRSEPLAGSSPPLTPAPPRSSQKLPAPDIILVIHESLGRQHLSWYGGDPEQRHTPWLAGRIGHERERWFIAPRHFTISTTTHLSVPSIWTGIHTSRSIEERSQAPMLWQWAHSAGYQTILATSQCYSWGEFEAFVDRAPPERFLGCEDFPDAEPVNDAGIDELDVATSLSTHLADLDPDRPLLLVYNSNALHQPFQTESPRHDITSLRGTDYEQALQVVDEAMRELFETLDTHRTRQERVVVMTADHGERPQPRHRVPRVESYHDEFARIPAIWRLPRRLQTTTFKHNLIAHNTSNLDILPTLLGIMGYPHDAFDTTLDGVDLRRTQLDKDRTILVKNVGPARRWHHTGELIVWRHYRLMRGDITGEQLHDVSRDPAQQRPLDMKDEEVRRVHRRVRELACEHHGERSSTCTAR